MTPTLQTRRKPRVGASSLWIGLGGAELAGDSGSARLSIASRLPLLFRSNEFAREIAHGVPGCGEAYRENGDEYQQYVHPTNAHGIGFYDEVAAIAKAQEAKLHL